LLFSKPSTFVWEQYNFELQSRERVLHFSRHAVKFFGYGGQMQNHFVNFLHRFYNLLKSVHFWVTVCKTVHPMLSHRCLSCVSCLSVLSVTLVHCSQTVGRIKLKLGMQVDLGPGHIVLDGDPAPPPQKGAEPPIFCPYLLWPNGSMDQEVTWYGGRPRPKRLCVRWGPRSLSR